jgi:hypothetical protein
MSSVRFFLKRSLSSHVFDFALCLSEKLIDWTYDGLGLQCYQPYNQRLNSWTKVLRVFFFAIHSHLYRFALRFLFLQTPATSYIVYITVQLLCTLVGEMRKTYYKTIAPSLWFRKPYRNLKSAISQDYAQKTQRNSTFMNSASGVYVISKRSGDGWRPVAKFMVPDLGG